MPYPILQLPYGLQRRLRGLATPKERYNLQVAIGFDKNYLSPLQMHNNNPKYFENQLWNTSELLFITTDVDLHYGCTNDDLFVFERNLKIINFEEFDFDKPWFDHFVINCESFGIGGGIMNSACLKKLSKLCDSKRITSLSLRDCTPDVSLCLIFESFSNLETISLHSPNYESNWIQDILSCKKLDLIGLEIESRFEKLFCFEPHELSLLYKNQPPTFHLNLYCIDPPKDAVERVRQKLESHFKELKGGSGYPHGSLEISVYKRLMFQIV